MIRNLHASSRRESRKGRRSRAWLNGVDVSSRCFYADDRAGVVRLYLVNVDGKKYVTAGKVATGEFRGRVRIGRAS